jgi:lysophospholipase L1-like esterase
MTRRAAALLAAASPAVLAASEEANARWDFLRTNLSVFPGTEKIFESDDDLFWKLKTNLQGVEASERLPEDEWPFRVSTDGNGRRLCPPVEAPARTALFLGDSCTFGIPVNDGESFPAQCQALVPGLRAVNAGVPGYTAFQGRLLLEKLAPRLRPDVVVMAFWVNGRTVWDHLSDLEHHELLAAERAGELSRHRLTRLLRRVQPGDRPRLTEEEFAGEIRALIRLAHDVEAKPVVAVWPTAPQMEGADPHPRQALLLRIAAEQKTPAVELAPAFRRAGGKRLFVDPVHATREGYRAAAEAAAGALEG